MRYPCCDQILFDLRPTSMLGQTQEAAVIELDAFEKLPRPPKDSSEE
jgi:hypothetical protein